MLFFGFDMRFLHTADWHVGKTLLGRPRLDEQEQVATEIVDIARRERVDCVLIAGDLFDSAAPKSDAQRVVCDTLADIAGSGIAAVIIGGNHDHRQLPALRRLAGRLKIFIRPGAGENDQGGVISLPKAGELAKIAMLPWIPEYRIIDSRQIERPKAEWNQVYSAHVADRCAKLARGFVSNTINILVAHLFVHGAEASGSERMPHVAEPFAVRPDQLPRAHYIALGHLHKPQEIAAASRCVYAGSPLQLDFGERGQLKRVVIVEAHPETPVTIQSVPLASGRRLREVVTTPDRLPRQDNSTDFLRVIVQTDKKVYGLSQKVAASLPNAVVVQQEFFNPPPDERPSLGLQNPRERFRQFVKEEKGLPVSDEILAAFDTLYYEAKHETDEA
jgi:exonuclease SbcD